MWCCKVLSVNKVEVEDAFQSVKKEIGASWNILHVLGVVEHVEYWQFSKAFCQNEVSEIQTVETPVKPS